MYVFVYVYVVYGCFASQSLRIMRICCVYALVSLISLLLFFPAIRLKFLAKYMYVYSVCVFHFYPILLAFTIVPLICMPPYVSVLYVSVFRSIFLGYMYVLSLCSDVLRVCICVLFFYLYV